MYNKINFVYTAYPHLGSAYFGTLGLERALRKAGKLHYAFNTKSGEFLDKEELQKYPVLYMAGHQQGKLPLIEAAGDQFKATFQPESFFTRHGKPDTSSALIREREHLFDVIFTVADTDVNLYSIPTIFCSPWADTNVTYPMPLPLPFNENLLFIGNTDGREDFLKQDKKKIIDIKNTEFSPDSEINAKRYSQLMAQYAHCVNPPGRFYNGVTGRMWEILACKRLCFQYYNEFTMFKTLAEFQDGEHIIYFKNIDELAWKHHYYLNHPEHALKIAENGHKQFLSSHTQDIRANFIADSILALANKNAKSLVGA